jgi:hypothetical protein
MDLIATLEDRFKANAEVVIERMLSWTESYESLLTFDETTLDFPAVRYNLHGGYAFWIARRTVRGDAKIEILTRTAKHLPELVARQLRDLLNGLVSATAPEDGTVLLFAISELNANRQGQLERALDFAIGASTALVISATRSRD